MKHIDLTLEAIEDKIADLSENIADINDTIQESLRTDSTFFASDEHVALFRARSNAQKLRDELHNAYMIIVSNFN